MVTLRMEAAQRAIEDARLLMESGSIRGAVNRAYYAMFYAASALAVSNNSGTFSKHAGLIAYIHREWVHTGKLEKNTDDHSKGRSRTARRLITKTHSDSRYRM